MELDVYTTTVELLDIPSYTTNITLEGQLLRLHFLWNERIGKRTLFITNTNEESYLQNTILHPNEPFELNSNAVYDELPYSVVLQKVGNVNRIGNILNWSKDYVLCFYRTVDAPLTKLNVLYGVTVPSTPILPKPFGTWILNEGFEIVGENIKYTAYKTNDLDYYDSFAEASLERALVKSFLAPDLQQYVAFTTAVEQLTGTVDWVLDSDNNQIVYTKETPSDPQDPSNEYIWAYDTVSSTDACKALINRSLLPMFASFEPKFHSISNIKYYFGGSSADCKVEFNNGNINTYEVNASLNPAYDPNVEQEQETLPLETVAQKVISNAADGAAEVLKMLSEDYINLVANSIFNSIPVKQFVKLSDLNSQLEANKVLR